VPELTHLLAGSGGGGRIKTGGRIRGRGNQNCRHRYPHSRWGYLGSGRTGRKRY
jgi:hypothetical protein